MDNHLSNRCKVDVYKLEELDIAYLSYKYSILPRPQIEYLKSKFDDSLGNRSRIEKEMKDNLYLTPKAVDGVLDYYSSDFVNFNYSTNYIKK